MTYDDALGIFWLFVLLGLWLLPIIIASIRKHRQLTPIILITVLASWTIRSTTGRMVSSPARSWSSHR